MQRLSNKAAPAAFLLSVLMTTALSTVQADEFHGPAPILVDFPGNSGNAPGHSGSAPGHSGSAPGHQPRTATPIKHVVVIFGENISFDHYFGTYPYAKNPKGEPAFYPLPYTPPVNGYNGPNLPLLYNNPNFTNTANNTVDANGNPVSAASNPFRIDRAQAHTASMNHNYGPEQAAFDGGKMDLFPLNTGRAGTFGTSTFATTALVMGYYDGNTVTAMWNYAQHFALNDNSFSSQFGPSTPGAINVISGQTNGVISSTGGATSAVVADGVGGLTLIGDADPTGDVCSAGNTTKQTGKNIGDLLNAKDISWGWFQGGFDLTIANANGTKGCQRSSTSATLNGTSPADYVAHHAAFQYYDSTSNPTHARPTVAPKLYGTSQDTVTNHQYDIHDFYDALAAGNLPAVSYLKAAAFQDAHPSNSDPLDEQTFVVNVINALQDSGFWEETAVIIAYDDSDGWYDHVHHVINPSSSTADDLEGAGVCKSLPGNFPAFKTPLPGVDGKTPVNGRCGYGPRQPLLVISPYAKHNFVDHTLTDQSSVVRFIEDNWLDGERIAGSYDAHAGTLLEMFDFFQKPTKKLVLDPTTGEVKSQ